MYCASCETEIPATFSHALRANECPACGSSIMDEESLALMEDLKDSISGEAAVRPETAERLAFMLVTTYEVSPRRPLSQRERPPAKRPRPKRISRGGDDESIVKMSDLADSDSPISDEERDQILKERLEARYGAVMTQDGKGAAKSKQLSPEYQRLVAGASQAFSDSELVNNPLLEQKRLERLARQQANLSHGAPSARSGAVVSRASDD